MNYIESDEASALGAQLISATDFRPRLSHFVLRDGHLCLRSLVTQEIVPVALDNFRIVAQHLRNRAERFLASLGDLPEADTRVNQLRQ